MNYTETPFRMPFGRFKGASLSALSDDYIAWLNSLDNLREPLRSAVEEEHRRRIDWNTGSRYRWRRGSNDTASNDDNDEDSRVDDDAGNPPEMTKELVAAGFKVLAQIHHPDHGGSDASMRQVIAARSWLLRQISALEVRQ